MVVRFGQIVVGPPGSGKTSYCKAMSSFLKELGRKVAIINLDPANDELPFTADINISDLITVEDVMETQNLGPNGALIECMEHLGRKISWLMDKLNQLTDSYLFFDFPGQAELYTHHKVIRNILNVLEKADFRLCSVFLVDSHCANDPGKYMSALLLTLSSMIHLEMPTVNILSKVDVVECFGKLEFGLDYYTEVMDLDYLVDTLDKGPLTKKYHKMNKAMSEVVSNYSLVSFLPLAVDNRETIVNVMKAVDKANGYIFGANEVRNIQMLLSCAAGAEFDHDRFGNARDKFTSEEDQDDAEEEILKLIATQNIARQ